jgi:putative membrane protein
MLELLIFAFLGSLLGIATGLVPGLHVNNLLPILVPLALVIGSYEASVTIVSMAVVQSFVGFIPSIFLGAPESDTSLSTLPGHRLLQEGRGLEAVRLTVLGGLGSLAVSLLLVWILSPYFRDLYLVSRPYIGWILLGMVSFIILSNSPVRKILVSAVAVAISGIFGLVVLESPVLNHQTVLFPVLSGLFGLSILATSFLQKSSLPPQSGGSIKSARSDLIKSIFLGSVAGLVVGFLPAIGVSQAAALFQGIGGLSDPRSFLVSLSGIGLANEVFSLNSVYLIGNPRSGSSVAIEEIMGNVKATDMSLFLSVIVFAAGIGAASTLLLSRTIPRFLVKLNYRTLSAGVFLLILSMVALTCGFYGILVALSGMSIGMLCDRLGARKSDCMGVLLVPSLAFFLL